MSPQVTAYGGELRYTVTHRAPPGTPLPPRHPDVLLQGNGILLEHFSSATPLAGVPTIVTVPIREVRVVPVRHPVRGVVEGGGQARCWGGVDVGAPEVRLGAMESSPCMPQGLSWVQWGMAVPMAPWCRTGCLAPHR